MSPVVFRPHNPPGSPAAPPRPAVPPPSPPICSGKILMNWLQFYLLLLVLFATLRSRQFSRISMAFDLFSATQNDVPKAIPLWPTIRWQIARLNWYWLCCIPQTKHQTTKWSSATLNDFQRIIAQQLNWPTPRPCLHTLEPSYLMGWHELFNSSASSGMCVALRLKLSGRK